MELLFLDILLLPVAPGMYTILLADECDARLDSIVTVCWTAGCWWQTTAIAGIVALPTDLLLCPVGSTDDLAALVSETQSYLGCLRIGCPAPPHLHHAWRSFHRQWEPLIRRMTADACRHAMPAVDHDDLVQEVWQEIVTKLPKMRYAPHLGGLSGWQHSSGVRRRRLHVANCGTWHDTSLCPRVRRSI
jgi:hypothetical protein